MLVHPVCVSVCAAHGMLTAAPSYVHVHAFHATNLRSSSSACACTQSCQQCWLQLALTLGRRLGWPAVSLSLVFGAGRVVLPGRRTAHESLRHTPQLSTTHYATARDSAARCALPPTPAAHSWGHVRAMPVPPHLSGRAHTPRHKHARSHCTWRSSHVTDVVISFSCSTAPGSCRRAPRSLPV